ncbi:conserved hypothetical protein [Oleispira antarctica RB-8]|uniref:DUF2569 domain-containing protein n=1 Tax=Oleispira antarctica RB-8 TaxID=698738 RepID=R4YQT5_OLEAN|nr:conserved hypothetical protein [Oleispira antarctica RB-8]
METSSDKLNGLSGWLILVAIGIVLTPIRIVALVLPMYADIFTDGTWDVLTTLGSDVYSPFWAPILIAEVVINIGVMGLWLYIAFIFFSKKVIFPKVYIGALLFSIAFIAIDAFAMTLVLPDEPIFDPETMKELFRSLISAIIWIPYMLKSKRVKATFTNT